MALPIVPLLMAMAVAAGLILVLLFDPGRARLAKRARGVAGEDGGRKTDPRAPKLRLYTPDGLDRVIHGLIPRPDALRVRLASTGMTLSIGQYGLVCIAVAVVLPLLMIVRGVPPILAILLGVGAGLGLPWMWVGNRIKARRRKFAKLFPEAIGLMVRGLKAGLPVTETMIVVAREVVDPVGEEFRRVCDQVRLGQPLEDALWATAKRLDMPEFNFLIITLSVQRETGGNLAETLENLDEILRKREQMRLKVKAMSSEAVASASIIGCLPFVIGALMYLSSKEYILTLFTNQLGFVMLGAGGASLLVGIGVMAKMESFDI